MQQDTRYIALLKKAGISVSDMANKLSKFGIGSPRQWQQTLQTGTPARFSDGDCETAKQLLDANRGVLQEVAAVLRDK